jgi:hypothetical protein
MRPQKHEFPTLGRNTMSPKLLVSIVDKERTQSLNVFNTEVKDQLKSNAAMLLYRQYTTAMGSLARAHLLVRRKVLDLICEGADRAHEWK